MSCRMVNECLMVPPGHFHVCPAATKAKCSVSSWSQPHLCDKANSISVFLYPASPGAQLCHLLAGLKNIVIAHQSRRLMFLVSFYFQTSHLLGYIIWHWVLGCSLSSHTELCLCVWIRYSISVIEMDGVILLWPSLRFSCCVCVCVCVCV